jgi:hypothetical protein
MPFILENSPRPVEIQFDPTNPKAKVEAEEEINKLLIQGFLEVSRTSQEQFIFVTLTKPSPGSDIGTMRIPKRRRYPPVGSKQSQANPRSKTPFRRSHRQRLQGLLGRPRRKEGRTY